MPSPFPGMDPWLEGPGIFPELHSTLITYIGDALNLTLPRPYYAKSATRVWIEDQRREPDVSVFDPSPRVSSGEADVAALLRNAGMIGVFDPAEPEPLEETYLEIHSSDDARLVTAIEVLSLSNKTPGDKGREAYRQKQKEFLRNGVGLVELDLLRGGQHTTAVSRSRLHSKAGFFAYHVSVSAAILGREHFATPIKLSDRLPTILIPLDTGVAPTRIDLQIMLDRCYDNRRYAIQVQYDQPCDPPLTPEQQAWADGILREKGLLK